MRIRRVEGAPRNVYIPATPLLILRASGVGIPSRIPEPRRLIPASPPAPEPFGWIEGLEEYLGRGTGSIPPMTPILPRLLLTDMWSEGVERFDWDSPATDVFGGRGEIVVKGVVNEIGLLFKAVYRRSGGGELRYIFKTSAVYGYVNTIPIAVARFGVEGLQNTGMESMLHSLKRIAWRVVMQSLDKSIADRLGAMLGMTGYDTPLPTNIYASGLGAGVEVTPISTVVTWGDRVYSPPARYGKALPRHVSSLMTLPTPVEWLYPDLYISLPDGLFTDDAVPTDRADAVEPPRHLGRGAKPLLGPALLPHHPPFTILSMGGFQASFGWVENTVYAEAILGMAVSWGGDWLRRVERLVQLLDGIPAPETVEEYLGFATEYVAGNTAIDLHPRLINPDSDVWRLGIVRGGRGDASIVLSTDGGCHLATTRQPTPPIPEEYLEDLRGVSRLMTGDLARALMRGARERLKNQPHTSGGWGLHEPEGAG